MMRATLTALIWVALVATPSWVLGQTWTITGQVTDLDGNGIEGVDIDFDGDSIGELDLEEDFTLADGTFALRMPAITDFYRVRFRSPPDQNFLDFETDDIFIFGPTDIGTFEMVPALRVSGWVVDEQGVGLAGIDLQYTSSTGEPGDFPNDDTNDIGFFDMLASADTWDIRFRQPVATGTPYVEFEFLDFLIDSEVELPVVRLALGATVTGTVQNGAGTGLAGVEIEVTNVLTGDRVRINNSSTGVGGTFSILLPEGPMELAFVPTPASGVAPLVAEIDVAAPPATTAAGTFTLPTSGTVTGTVVDGGGLAVNGVDLDFAISASGVSVDSIDDNSDPTGAFSVVVPEDTYDITLRPSFASGLVPVREESVLVSGTTALGTITLESGNALTGVVTDGVLPIRGVEVTLVDTVSGLEVPVFGNRTRGDGSYALRQVSGTYDVTFTPPTGSGGTPTTFTDVDLTADATLDATFTVTATPAVTGLLCTIDTWNVALEWTNGAADYDRIEIVRDGAVVMQLLGDATSTVDVAVEDGAGGDYDYEVRAIRNGVVSTAATCLAGVVARVQQFSCEIDDGDVELTWLPGAFDYDAIEIYRTPIGLGGVPGTTTLLATLDGGALFYSDVAAPSGTSRWEVRPTRGTDAAFGAYCTTRVTPPVTGLTCSVVAGTATLNWTNGSLVYNSVDVFRNGTLLQSLEGIATSFSDPGLTDGAYVYEVRGVEQLVLAKAATCREVIGPDTLAVTGLTCSIDGLDAALSWTNGEVYDAVEVRRNGVLLASLAGGATTYDDLGAPAGQHDYGVQGVVGTTASPVEECSLVAVAPPGAVATLTCTVVDSDVTLAWTLADSYESIEIDRDGVLLVTLDGTATSHDDLGLPSGSYDYAVRGVRFGATSGDALCTATIAAAATPPVTSLVCSSLDNDVTLTWVNGAADYDTIEVLRDGGLIATLAGTATSYDDLDLVDATYEYTVSAVRSSIVATGAVCPATVSFPTPPVSALACAVVDADAALTWTNGAPDYDLIEVLRDGVLVASLAGTATSYDDLALANGTYEYTVTAVRSANPSSDSLCSATIAIAPPPVTGLGCVVTTDDIALTWTNAAGDYDAVEIWRNGMLLMTLAGSAVSYDDLDMPDGVYDYSVVAVRDGLSSAGAECEATVAMITPPVTDLTCVVTDDDVALSWINGAADYDSIEITRDGALLATLAGDATSYDDVDLLDGTYFYDVTAIRRAASTSSSCRIDISTAVPAVSAVTCVVTEDDVALSWTNGAADYDAVEISRDAVLLVTLAGDATSYDDLDLANGAYDYSVVAVRSTFVSPAVECEAIVTTATPSVTDLTCVATGGDVVVSWINGAADYDSIDILRDTVLLATLAGDATSYDDLALADGDYSYEVVAIRGGDSASAATCMVTIGDAGTQFLRGDVDGNGTVFALLDTLYLLQFAFSGGPAPVCSDAADADDNGTVFALIDGLFLLQWGFVNGPVPPAPGVSECGVDPTDDDGVDCLEPTGGC